MGNFTPKSARPAPANWAWRSERPDL